MALTILPAIDLKGGQCVRLQQGRAEDVTVYGADPVAMAKHWQDAGGTYLHVVDLDGAFDGRPRHTEVIRQIVAALDIPVEVGGGLRTTEDIVQLLETGVDRVIVGTRACDAPDELRAWVARFGPRLAVGIDARDGQVQTKGWTETTATRAVDLAAQIHAWGVATLIYTDTARDGMLEGVNVQAMADVCDAVAGSAERPATQVIASGGVSSCADVRALTALNRPNLAGAIVGKALYEKRVTLPELKEAT